MNFLNLDGITLENIITELGDAIVVIDKDLNVVGINEKMSDRYKLKINDVIGKNTFEIYKEFKTYIFYNVIMELVNDGVEKMKIEYSNNAKKWITIRSKKVNDLFVFIINDLMDEINKDSYIQKYDSLTGLPNKFKYDDDFKNFKNKDAKFLFLIDVKKFHLINENLGIKNADLCLIEISSRLKNSINKLDAIYKMNSDQFLVVTYDKDIEKIKSDILNVFNNKFIINRKEIKINIRLSCYKIESFDNLENGIRCLDVSLNHAKREGIDFIIYSSKLERIDNPFDVEHLINVALNNNEFELYYQAQQELTTNNIVGTEVLIRWNNPKDGFMQPNRFLPIAKELGLMKKIDRWVFDKVIKDSDILKENGIHLPIFINISGDTLVDLDMQDYMINVLSKRYFKNLCFEFTENELMDFNKSKKFINELRDLGYMVAIDDFGTGYCSLEYLLNYSCDYLKIDERLINRVDESIKGKQILENIINFGHSLNIKMIAEGVEFEEELTILKKFKCDLIQGYIFSRPVNLKDYIWFCINNGAVNN